MNKGHLRSLTTEELRRIQETLGAAPSSEMTCEEAVRLFGDVVHSIRPERGPTPERDPRIVRVMARIEEVPFDEASVPMLAREIGLSESRLRDLFRRDLGCTVSQYIRWVAAWKAIHLWQRGMKFTDVAHAVGFHDLAHADHTLGETFGMTPSAIARIRLHRCRS